MTAFLSSLSPVRSLLTAIFMLMAGSGFLATLVALRLERAGSGTLMIGAVATCYFAGLVTGALRVGPVVGRVGHIRAFAACVALLSASTLAYAMFQHPLFWAGLRLIDGFCVAGVFVCLESWLNDRADEETRGAMLGAYMVALYSGQALGQLFLGVAGALPAMPFQIASILISFAILPLCLTRSAAPPPPATSAFSARALFDVSPLGAIGAGATGLMLGAFYGMGAVHVRRLGLDLAETASFMMIVILGGVALQWPLGRLSDRHDRRRFIILCFAATMAVSLGLASLQRDSWMLLMLGGLFGGLSFALYPLCVAHANDRLAASDRVGASGQLVLLYSVGAALGPVGGAALMTLVGTAGLFLFVALCAGLTLCFGFWRQFAAQPVPAAAQQDFQILPRTTPIALPEPPDAESPETEAVRERATMTPGNDR